MFLLYLQTITKFQNNFLLSNLKKKKINNIFNKLNKNKNINMFCKFFNVKLKKQYIKIKNN